MLRSVSPLLAVLGALAALLTTAPGRPASAEEPPPGWVTGPIYVRIDWGDFGESVTRAEPVEDVRTSFDVIASEVLGDPVWAPVVRALNDGGDPWLTRGQDVWLPPIGRRVGDPRPWFSAFVGEAKDAAGGGSVQGGLQRQGPGYGCARITGPFVVWLLPHRSDADAALASELAKPGGPDPSRVPGMLRSDVLEPPRPPGPPGPGMAQRAVPVAVWRVLGIAGAGVRLRFVRWEAIEPLDPHDMPALRAPASPKPSPASPGASVATPWLAVAAFVVLVAFLWARARRRRPPAP